MYQWREEQAPPLPSQIDRSSVVISPPQHRKGRRPRRPANNHKRYRHVGKPNKRFNFLKNPPESFGPPFSKGGEVQG